MKVSLVETFLITHDLAHVGVCEIVRILWRVADIIPER